MPRFQNLAQAPGAAKQKLRFARLLKWRFVLPLSICPSSSHDLSLFVFVSLNLCFFPFSLSCFRMFASFSSPLVSLFLSLSVSLSFCLSLSLCIFHLLSFFPSLCHSLLRLLPLDRLKYSQSFYTFGTA